MSFELSVQVSGFPSTFSAGLNGFRTETLSTADVIRAAIVAGHPNHSSLDPRIVAWRTASIRLALQISPLPAGIPRYLIHPKAWEDLERSEKAGLQNILGNTVTKLLSERVLNAPRMWFLDMYQDRFSIYLPPGKRPDFFAKTKSGRWLSLEAKGRANSPSTASLTKAKSQAQALKKIKGTIVAARVVCWTMSRGGILAARLHDPDGDDQEREFSIDVDDITLLKDYYAPVQTLIEASEPIEYGPRLKLYNFLAGDFLIGLHPALQKTLHLMKSEPTLAGEHFDDSNLVFESADDIPCGPDGVIVVPGRSWPNGLEERNRSS